MILAAAVAAALCQGPIGTASDDLARFDELTRAAPAKPDLFRRWSSVDCGELLLLLDWRSYLHSGFPDDRNDGALWQGRGISTALTAGARGRWKWFSAGFVPVIAWQQNRDFAHRVLDMKGYSPYANPFNGGAIDLPVRFGPDAFWTVDPGQSFVRADVTNVAVGFSTENLWWGPGTRNSLLMTNTGAGFRHLFIGTSHPQDIWIGNLEAQLLWGWPSQSDYFRDDGSGNRRLFTALTLGYEPRWIPGLYVGAARVFLYRVPPEGLPFRDYFFRLFEVFHSGFNSTENQLISILARWVFPESGLEIYGEFARDDYSADIKDAIEEPDHASAYMFGLQKAFAIGPRRIRLVAEQAHTLTIPMNNPVRGVPIFYTHGGELQGYTNGGQMIGAGIGPQADSQYLALDLFHEYGRTGLWLERVLRNDRYFYDQYHLWLGHDAELAFGLRGVFTWRNLDVEWMLGRGTRYNAYLVRDGEDWKFQLSLTARTSPLR